MATFHVALEDLEGRIGLVPYTADRAPEVGATVVLDSGAQGVVDRVSDIDGVALYHVKQTV